MLCFEYLGKYFQHQSLPFGLAVAPREWQRAMQAVVKYMRQKGATIWVYLDDFLILGASKEIVASNVAILLELLASLGLEVNFAKSELNPIQNIRYLGFQLNLEGGVVEVPLAKLANATKDVRAFLRAPYPTVRKATSVLGTLRGLMFAYPQIKLWTDALMNHVRSHQDRPWDAPAPLSSGTRL